MKICRAPDARRVSDYVPDARRVSDHALCIDGYKGYAGLRRTGKEYLLCDQGAGYDFDGSDGGQAFGAGV